MCKSIRGFVRTDSVSLGVTRFQYSKPGWLKVSLNNVVFRYTVHTCVLCMELFLSFLRNEELSFLLFIFSVVFLSS